MGRSRSRSRTRNKGDYDDDNRSSSHHKSREQSRGVDDEESLTKEERRARRHQRRKEQEESAEYASRGGYDNSSSGYPSVPGGFDYQQQPYGGGAAPYPETPQETHASYSERGTDYQQSSYPADSYAASQYAGGYTAPVVPAGATEYGPATYQDYSAHSQSQGYSQETQSYDTSHQTSTGYYQESSHTSPPPAVPYGPPAAPYPTDEYATTTEHYAATTGQYGDQTYNTSSGYAAPQPPYPTEHGDDAAARSSSQGYYGGTPAHDYQSGYAAPPTGYSEVPRNPSTHNYNPRPEPSGPLPQAEPSFQMGPPAASYEERWQPTAAPEKEKLSIFRSFRTGLHNAVRDLASTTKLAAHSGVHSDGNCTDPDHFHSDNRFESFASPHPGNSIKWFVDGIIVSFVT
ncbi:hypothetical protein TWF694_007005 [Orbilia ellipsospora]|uniref:Uncharacterized protein n=1 Tax=Orbilia ellipsospora TaxID=2528407 RepID=A0AAV9XQ96_9PEZI